MRGRASSSNVLYGGVLYVAAKLGDAPGGRQPSVTTRQMYNHEWRSTFETYFCPGHRDPA